MSNHHIIIADDSEAIRQQIKQVCANGGYNKFSEARNGREALDLAKLLIGRGEHVTMMLVDMNMPELNGLQLIKLIKEDESLQHIPAIMITTKSESAHVVQAIECGVSEYIVKPIDEAMLLGKINKIMLT